MTKIFKPANIQFNMKKRAMVPLLYIIVIFSIVALGYFAVTYSLSVYDSSLFAKPLWGRLECSAEDFKTTNIKWLDQQTVFPCNYNTQSCDYTVTNTKSSSADIELGAIHPQYYVCDISGNNCGSVQQIDLSKGETKTLPSLDVGKSYKFIFGYGLSYDYKYTKVTWSYNAFKLFRYYGGAKDIINSFDCSLQSGDLSKIREKDYTVPVLKRTGGIGDKWVNYVEDWAYGPAINIYNYNGQKAYCTAGKLYSIVKLQMKDGSLVQLAPDYQGTTNSGETISGMGSLIATVTCCPQEPNCGTDFKYHNPTEPPTLANPAKDCFTDVQCYNGGSPVPIDTYHYQTYSCIANKCKANNPILVECTNNAGCMNGQLCDLSTNNYGKCITQKTGEYCGDGVCQTDENNALCPADCSFTCKPTETLISEKSYTFWSILGLTKPTELKYCKTSSFWDKYGLYIILLSAVALIFVSWFYFKNQIFIYFIVTALGLYFAYSYLGQFFTIFLVIIIAVFTLVFMFRRAILRLFLL